MLGSEALIRLSLVISFPPGASGTLKSTLMKTRFPFKSRSRIERVLTVSILPKQAPTAAAHLRRLPLGRIVMVEVTEEVIGSRIGALTRLIEVSRRQSQPDHRSDDGHRLAATVDRIHLPRTFRGNDKRSNLKGGN